MNDDSLNHQTGGWAVSLAKSDPLTVGSSDHFDSVAQKRLPLGAELQLALNLIPAHTWYAAPSGALTFLNERGSDYLGLLLRARFRQAISGDASGRVLEPLSISG